MGAVIENSIGIIKISNDVLAKLAGYAATCCYGVVGMAVRNGKDGIAKLLKMDSMTKGVKIKLTDGALDIDLYIMVEYGININTIGQSIRNNVKYQIETVTGLEVRSVNIHVESVRVG